MQNHGIPLLCDQPRGTSLGFEPLDSRKTGLAETRGPWLKFCMPKPENTHARALPEHGTASGRCWNSNHESHEPLEIGRPAANHLCVSFQNFGVQKPSSQLIRSQPADSHQRQSHHPRTIRTKRDRDTHLQKRLESSTWNVTGRKYHFLLSRFHGNRRNLLPTIALRKDDVAGSILTGFPNPAYTPQHQFGASKAPTIRSIHRSQPKVTHSSLSFSCLFLNHDQRFCCPR